MVQTAPAEVTARAPPLRDRLRWLVEEEEDLGVTPRQPLDRVEPPRTASMLVANMPRKMMEILQTPTPHLYQCRQGVLGSTVRARK